MKKTAVLLAAVFLFQSLFFIRVSASPSISAQSAVVIDAESGKIAIYYGSADTYTGLAFTTVDKVVDYIKKHSI